MKNPKHFIAVLLLIAFASPALAQEETPEIPYIEVEGNAKRKIIPDQIYVSVELMEKTIGKKYLSLDEQETKFNEIIERMNIDKEKVSLTNAVSSIIQRRDRDRGVVRTKVYQVELASAAQVSELFSQLSANGIRETDIVKLEHSDIINIRKQVRIDAIVAAKEKAEYLTAAIGYTIGQPLEIREAVNFGSINQSVQQFNAENVMVRGYAGEIVTGVDFERIEVSFAYYIKYEIKPN